jgi:hypothetical protein
MTDQIFFLCLSILSNLLKNKSTPINYLSTVRLSTIKYKVINFYLKINSMVKDVRYLLLFTLCMAINTLGKPILFHNRFQ